VRMQTLPLDAAQAYHPCLTTVPGRNGKCTMRLLGFQQTQASLHSACASARKIVNLTAEGLPSTLDELLRAGLSVWEAAARAGATARTRVHLSDIAFLPPVIATAKAIAVGPQLRGPCGREPLRAAEVTRCCSIAIRAHGSGTAHARAASCGRPSSTTKASCWW
jgi:hypothetical protein